MVHSIYVRGKICLKTPILAIAYRSDFVQPTIFGFSDLILDVYLFLFRAHLSLSTTEWRWYTFDCNFLARRAQWPYIPYIYTLWHDENRKYQASAKDGATTEWKLMETLTSTFLRWDHCDISKLKYPVTTAICLGVMIQKADRDIQSDNHLIWRS